MPPSPSFPTFPVDCRGGPGIRIARRGTAVVISAADTPITTGGADENYTAQSEAGDVDLYDGLAVLVRLDRTSPANPTFTIDGSPRAPLTDIFGIALPEGALVKDGLQRIIYDALRGIWVADGFGLFDKLMRLWFVGLPTSPDGIGPLAPWRNGGLVSWTDENNPSFPSDSPESRRLLLRSIRDALPTSPDGLAPGDAWLNGDTISFVPLI